MRCRPLALLQNWSSRQVEKSYLTAIGGYFEFNDVAIDSNTRNFQQRYSIDLKKKGYIALIQTRSL